MKKFFSLLFISLSILCSSCNEINHSYKVPIYKMGDVKTINSCSLCVAFEDDESFLISYEDHSTTITHYFAFQIEIGSTYIGYKNSNLFQYYNSQYEEIEFLDTLNHETNYYAFSGSETFHVVYKDSPDYIKDYIESKEFNIYVFSSHWEP